MAATLVRGAAGLRESGLGLELLLLLRRRRLRRLLAAGAARRLWRLWRLWLRPRSTREAD